MKELPYNKLRIKCNENIFKFKDTSEVTPFRDIIGQDRAVESMKFGLRIRQKGYNVYMSGVTGTGKTSFAEKYIKSVAETQKTPDDWCYVYNFTDPTQPIAINLPAGQGKVFQKDMEELVKILRTEILKAFDNDEYERSKAKLRKEFRDRKEELIEKLDEEAEKYDFRVKITSSGIYFLPIVDGKAINIDDFNELDEEIKHEISKKSDIIQIETSDIIRKIRNLEREEIESIEKLENEIALNVVSEHIKSLISKYSDNEKIVRFLNNVQKDILEDLSSFVEEEESSQQQAMIPWMDKSSEQPGEKYKVNLLVDNSKLKGAPVILDFNPTYYNLLGKTEYENEFGSAVTDYTMIKPGLFHAANGGYLILQAKDVLGNVQSWEAMMRVLKTRQISIENMGDQMGIVAVSTLRPEPIPADLKIILIGSEYIYQLLYEYDEDFRKYFKIKVDFDDEMPRTEENITKLAGFISAFCSREGTPHFDRSGVAGVVDYSSRLVEDQTKLSTRFNEIADILSEAAACAEIEGSPLVNGSHVKKAIQQKNYRSDKYDKKLLELLEDGTIMIDTDGEVVGQINGLSILDMGDYAFGKPSRITATTYMGKTGIINIEREIEMSGTSHSKGVLILSGYIGQKYAQDIPLSLSASLCFEQLYNGVDGDSASSAELYALLSSLAEVPIKQSIAVTGSVNQNGEIQPVGGVTSKIEGFFELCRLRGLNGKHGVIIPHQNIKNLMLNDDVVDAVKKGLFHIYPVKTVDEGIEILTGLKAGKKTKSGKFTRGTLNYLVYKKLEKFARIVSGFEKEKSKK